MAKDLLADQPKDLLEDIPSGPKDLLEERVPPLEPARDQSILGLIRAAGRFGVRPVASTAIEQATRPARRIGEQVSAGFIEEASLGFAPKVIFTEEEREEIKPKTTGQKIGRGVGTTLGFLLGGPGQVVKAGGKLGLRGLARVLPGAGRFARAAAAGAGGFGLLETVRAPRKELKEKLVTVPTVTAVGAGLGITAEALSPVFSKIGSFISRRIVKAKDTINRFLTGQTPRSAIPRNRSLVPVRGDTFVLKPDGTGDVIKRADKADVMLQRLNQQKTAETFRQQVPKAEEFAGNIRVSKFPKEAQPILKQIAQDRPEVVTTTKIPDKQIKAMSDSIQKTGKVDVLEPLFKKPQGTLAAEINAVRENTADAILGMSDDIDAILGQVKQTSRVAQESGLALRQFRFPLGREVQAVKAIDQRIKATADPAVRGKLSEIKDLITKGREREFNPNIWDKIVEWATAIKLSSLKTPARAFIGNTFNKLIKTPERAATAAVDKAVSVLTGRSQERFGAEVLADVAGSSRSMKAGFKGAIDTLLDENRAFQEATRAGEALLGRGAIGGKLGRIVRIPFRFTAAPDVLIRTMDKGGQIGALTIRQALREGLRGAAAANRAAQLRSDPSIIQKAEELAAKTVFQEPLVGITKQLNRLRNWPAGRLIAPFFKTPVNLLKTFLRKTPATVLLPSSRAALKGIAKVGGGEGSEVIGEALLGSTILAGLIAYAWDGNITGRGPKSRAERDALFREGWQPNSLKIGDKYISYRGLEPMSDFLQVAASIAESKEAPTDERAKKITFDLVKNFGDQPFLTGVNDLISAFEDERQAGRFLNNFVSGNIVPTGLRSITQALSPELKKPEGILQTIGARIPGIEESILPRRNAFGEKVSIPGSPLARLASPVRISRENITPVDVELKKLGKVISFPSTNISNLKLTPEEYDKYLSTSGPLIKKGIATLITMPEYQESNARDKIKFIDSVIDNARDDIREEILTEKVIDGINAKGPQFLLDLEKEKKLTTRVAEIGAAYLQELGVINK